MVRPEDRDFMLNHIHAGKVQALRNGLEDSYWYGDDDERVFNELVMKAEAFDAILKAYDETLSEGHLADEVCNIIQKYESGVDNEQ